MKKIKIYIKSFLSDYQQVKVLQLEKTEFLYIYIDSIKINRIFVV